MTREELANVIATLIEKQAQTPALQIAPVARANEIFTHSIWFTARLRELIASHFNRGPPKNFGEYAAEDTAAWARIKQILRESVIGSYAKARSVLAPRRKMLHNGLV